MNDMITAALRKMATWGLRRVRSKKPVLPIPLQLTQLEGRITPTAELTFRGGLMVSVADVNRDGVPDLIGSPGPGTPTDVVIYNGVDGNLITKFRVIDSPAKGGVFLATGDFDNDGIPEIVTGASSGLPIVKIFSVSTGQVMAEFLAYDPTVIAGVRVAVGDVNGDGVPEIVTAPGLGGGPHIAVFQASGQKLSYDFMAYKSDFRGGASVATGDLDSDGIDEILVAAGEGGASHIVAYNVLSQKQYLSFFAFDSNLRGGAWVASGDVDGNGLADVIVGAGIGQVSEVKVFAGNGTPFAAWDVYESTYSRGVLVAAADLNGDAFTDVITAPGYGGGPRVTMWDGFRFAREHDFFAVTDGQPQRFGWQAPPPRTLLYDGVTFVTPGLVRERTELVSDLLRRLTFLPGEVGVYRVDDREGRVGNLLPSDSGYAQAALANDRRLPLFTANSAIQTTGVFELESATRYGFYLVRGGTTEQLITAGYPDEYELGVVFPFASTGVNATQFRVGPRNRAAFEDVAQYDNDYNDIIVDIRLASEQSDLPGSGSVTVNLPPVANPDEAMTPFQTPVVVPILTNDTDPDNDPLVVSSVTQPQNGRVQIRSFGVEYVPNEGFEGEDRFNYTIRDGRGGFSNAEVHVTVKPNDPVNRPPVAGDDQASTKYQTAITIPVLANDTDPDNDSLQIVTVGEAKNGIVLFASSTITYTPATGFQGIDTVSYTISDGRGGTSVGTVTVTVLPTDTQNRDPLANDDLAATPLETAITIPVLTNDIDPDGDPLTILNVSNAVNGTAQIDGLSIRYTPHAGFRGRDTFAYTISDGRGGTATANVVVVVGESLNPNQPPVANPDSVRTTFETAIVVNVLANDSDPENTPLQITTVTLAISGQVEITAGQITYTPNAGFAGTDTFAYTISDGELTSSALVTVVVDHEPNRSPIARDDEVQTAYETVITIPVLDNDTDPYGDPLTIVDVVNASNGTVAIRATGLEYTPNPGFSGLDRFQYTISDGRGGLATATVRVTVAEQVIINRPPVAVDDAVRTPFQTPVLIFPLQNDSDPDNDPLQIMAAGPAQFGVLETQDEQLLYTPMANFSGTELIAYTISDGRGGTATATVLIVVDPIPSDYTDWTAAERGGRSAQRGRVDASSTNAVLREGDSFLTTLSKSFVISAATKSLRLDYTTLGFDRTDTGFVNDAFEVALLDQTGSSLVPVFAPNRDAFFNVTDGGQVSVGPGTTHSNQSIVIDVSQVPDGTTATLMLRLINNDTDIGSTVTLAGYLLPAQSADATVKFFVVDDGTDRTFRYGEEGSGAGTFALTANASPTGAASNPAGDRVWIVDSASKQIAVYGPTGNTLGAWTASDVINPQGVTVDNGTLWLVDRGSLTVRRYVGGALRTSGDGNATDSFALNTANTSPSDLVTDGSTIWVTDDVLAEVFVYTLTGELLGRWELDGDNVAPSGITKNPAGGNDLWVLDRATKQVFQYPKGTNLRSGSANAAGTFQLARTNTTPEGIADPPTIVASDFKLELVGEVPNTPGAIEIVHEGRGYTPGIYVAGSPGAYEGGGDDWLYRLGFNGDVQETTVLPAETDPTSLEMPPSGSAFGDFLYLVGGNLDGGRGGDNGGSIVRVTPTGQLQSFSNVGIPDFSDPNDLIFSTGGDFGEAAYVADWNRGNSAIRKLNPDGSSSTFVSPQLRGTSALAFLDDGNGILKMATTSVFEPTYRLVGADGAVSSPIQVGVQILSMRHGVGGAFGRGLYLWQVDGKIRRLESDGTTSVIAESFGLNSGADYIGNDNLEFDEVTGDLYVLHRELNQPGQVYRITPAIPATIGPPSISVSATGTTFPFDESTLLTGLALADISAGANRIVSVTMNDVSVDLLDPTGNFWSGVDVQAGENVFHFVATDQYGQTAETSITLRGETRTLGSFDAAQFIDLSAGFKAEYSRTSYKQSGRELYADVAVRNISQYPAGVPLYVAVKNISDPAVQVLNSAGQLPDGTPYYDFTGLVSGDGSQLAPEAMTGTLSLSFANPNRGRFTYDLVFLGVPNRPPAFTSIPELEATIGREYVYPSTAADPDNDTLTFSLVSGPTGLTIDPRTGRVTWTPTSTQVGNFPVTIRVNDGRGGTAEQSYTIVSEVSRQNRPPVFTSLPIGEAQVGQVYRYDADATDPDRDTLTYSLATGFPDGMTIDATTGVITWTPTNAQLRDTPVTVITEDGRGGRAEQTYTICVKNDANRPPVIVSEPVRVATPGVPSAFAVSSGFRADLIHTLSANENIGGIAPSADGGVYFNAGVGQSGTNTEGKVYRFDPSTRQRTVLITSGLRSPNRMIVSQGGPLGTDLILADHNVGGGEQGSVLRIDRSTGEMTRLLFGARNRDIGDPSGLTFGRGLFGSDLYVIDFQGTSSQLPLIERIDQFGVASEFATGLPWSTSTSPFDLEMSPGGEFGEYLYAADTGGGIWRVGPDGSIGQFTTSDPVTPVAIRFGTGGAFGSTLYVLDTSGKILTVDSTGKVKEFASGLGITIKEGHVADIRFSTSGDKLYLGIRNELYEITPTRTGLYTYSVAALDPDGGPLTYSLTQKPDGMTIDATTGLVSWVPTVGSNIVTNFDFSDGYSGLRTDLFKSTIGIGAGSYTLAHNPYPWHDGAAKFGDHTTGDGLMMVINGSVIPDELIWEQDVTIEPGTDYEFSFWARSWTRGFPGRLQLWVDDVKVGTELELPLTTTDWVQYRGHWNSQASTSATISIRNATGQFSGNDFAIDDISFAVTGESLAGQSFPVTIRVDDSRGGSDEQRFTVTIGGTEPPAPSVGPPPDENTAVANSAFRLPLPTKNSAGDDLTFSVQSGPNGLMVHPTLGMVAWVPKRSEIGSYQVVVKASDPAGNMSLVPFTVNVVAPNTAPVITSLAAIGPVTVGLIYEYRVFAQDAEQSANELRFSLRDALPGMAVDANTGVFTWTPTVAQVGSRTVNIVVSDGITASEQSFPLEVIATSTNRDPLVSVIAANASAWLGREFVTVVTGSDPAGDPVRFELVNGPTGMTIDSNTGVIRWPNPAITATALPIEVRATDGRSGVATATFTLNVTVSAQNREPQIVSVPPRIGLVGSPYRYDLTARDADGDTALWQLVSAPQGASLDPVRGTLRWTPADDQTGLHTFTVRVLDSHFTSSEQTFTVDVSCENQPPNIVSRPPTVAYVNDPYFYAVRAADPESDALSFTLESGPSGMAFTPGTSLLRWTPTAAQAGPQNVTVRVTDSAGNISRQTFTIVVSTESPNRPPVITSRPPLLATLDRVYSYPVAARDPDGDTLTYTLSEKPDGMTISASGVISWTPTVAGTHRITAEVTDGRGGIAVQTFTLTARANQAPTIATISDTDAAIGTTFRVLVRATDPENDPITFSLISAPAGMAIDTQGRIAWAVGGTPRSETVIVSVTDSGGLSTTEEFIVRVIADTQAPNVRIQVTDRVTIGATVQVTVLASDNVGVASVSLTANGTPVALDAQSRAFIPASQVGRITFVATATDLSGNTGTASADLRVIDPNAVSDVRANITRLDRLVAPGQVDSVVTDDNTPAPDIGFLTDVIGTVESIGQPLLEWKLLVARGDDVDLFNINVDSPVWREIAHGTTTITNGKLGTFDPTNLPNDRYVLALAAYDVTGAGYVKPVEVNVIGNAKLGEFRLEFTDLSIPLNGIPIQISRIYDTRESTVSKDFGFGWTMGVRDARIRETVPAGESLIPDKSKVYLTAPDGSRVGFTYKERFSSGSFFGAVFTPFFVADKGHTYSLTTPSDPQSFRGGIIGGLAGEGINPSHYRLTTPEGVSYDYDQFAGLQKIADMNNNIVTFTANEIRHSGGKAITLDRDGQGRITTIRLPDGNVALRYRYDSKGDLVGIQQITEITPTEKALASNVTYRADRPHYLDEYFDANGKRAAKTEYDPVTGRLVAIIDANGNRSEQISDPANFAETVKDARGNPTFITYNSRGNVTKTVQPTEFGDIVTQFFYDDPANPDLETKVINGRGFATTKTFDERGNLLTETTDDGTTTYKYNAANKLTFVEDPLGRRTIYDYSPAGNLVQVVNPLGDDSLFTYDANGRVATFEDFAGNTTMFADYCFCGRPMTITNPDGSIRRLQYNGYGQVLEATDERGNITRNFYDNQGRLIEVRDGEQVANNTTGTRYEYTGNNQTKIIDPLGRITEYKYDDGGRKTHIIDAEGGVVVFGYDANGNLTKVTDPVNNLTEFRFDKANRVMEEIDPLLASRFFEYDAAGNRTKATDRNGKVRTFDYDPLNRQTFEYWLENGSKIRVIESKYDDVGNLLYSGDPDAILTYTFDALNRVKTATTVYPNSNVPTFTLTYGYDKNGNRNSVVDNTGVRVDSKYDDRNQLESRTWQGGGIDAAKVVFDYFDNGERKSLDRYADATGTNAIGSTSYDYWRNGLSKTISHANSTGGVLVNYDYQYDAAGRLTQESHHGNIYIYGYDKTSQLLTVNKDGSLFESFGYDASGNRSTSTGPNGNQTYVPAGPGNQLLNDGIHTYTYDREGNLKTKTVIATREVTEYSWDHRNRLVSVEHRTAGGIILTLSEYVYDARGRRIAQETNGETLWTVYDRDHAWVDTNVSGVVEERHLFADRIDEILARWQPGEGTVWHLSDKLGTVRDLVNTTGAIVNRISYLAFGAILAQTNATVGDRFTFTGREWDAAIGDYYYRARYYNANTGRFANIDPIGFESNQYNLYKYVANLPTSSTDPFGEDLIGNVVAIGSIAVVTVTAISAVSCYLSYYNIFDPIGMASPVDYKEPSGFCKLIFLVGGVPPNAIPPR